MGSGVRREREDHDRLQERYKNLHEKYRNEKAQWLDEKKQLNSKINNLEEHIENKKNKKIRRKEWLTAYNDLLQEKRKARTSGDPNLKKQALEKIEDHLKSKPSELETNWKGF